MSATGAREFDVVLFGATGFTGRLVVEHFLRTYGPPSNDFRWAVAGRSKDKLVQVLEEQARAARGGDAQAIASSIPVLVGDSSDETFLSGMATRTKVVVTTVGPYTKYGSKLVAACAAHGTHYADLTGEVLWVHDMLIAHEARAKKSGAKIVHCCGFDSVPSDIGALWMLTQLKSKGLRPQEIKYLLGPTSMGVSGGTIHSIAAMVQEAMTKGRLPHLMKPYYLLVPPDVPRAPVKAKPRLLVTYDGDVRGFIAPFVLAGGNTAIVVRSSVLNGYDPFTYSEAMVFQGGLWGLVKAWCVFWGVLLLGIMVVLPPTRWALLKLVPPGSGPSEEKRKQGYAIIYLVGKGTDQANQVQTVLGTFRIPGDPGYQETAKMIGEIGHSLSKLPKGEGGFFTPASALGHTLIERLDKQGMRFSLDQ